MYTGPFVEKEELRHIMAGFTQQINEIQADLTDAKQDFAALATAVTGFVDQIAKLNTTVQGLQAQLASASLTVDQQDALTKAVTAADALKVQGDAVVSALPPAPPVTPLAA